MEVTSWNLPDGSYLMELTRWKLRHGTYAMELTSLYLLDGSYCAEYSSQFDEMRVRQRLTDNRHSIIFTFIIIHSYFTLLYRSFLNNY